MDADRLRATLAGRDADTMPSRPGPSGDLPDDYTELIGQERPAAVLVPVVMHQQLEVLLTRRTDHLKDHAGQISFPGGSREDGDVDLIATALREAEEEVGLDARQLEVIGTLDTYLTITGFAVTPVVALVSPPLELRPDPHEVAEAFTVPLPHLLDGGNFDFKHRTIKGREVGYWSVPYGEYDIWGATAGILQVFRRTLLEGKG